MKISDLKFSGMVFFIGFLGGLVPTLLEVAGMLKNRESLNTLGLDFLGGIVLLALIGGIVAWIWDEKKMKKIFITGAIAPFLIRGVTGEMTRTPKNKESLETVSSLDKDSKSVFEGIVVPEPKKKEVNGFLRAMGVRE